MLYIMPQKMLIYVRTCQWWKTSSHSINHYAIKIVNICQGLLEALKPLGSNVNTSYITLKWSLHVCRDHYFLVVQIYRYTQLFNFIAFYTRPLKVKLKVLVYSLVQALAAILRQKFNEEFPSVTPVVCPPCSMGLSHSPRELQMLIWLCLTLGEYLKDY